ncbi:MAG: ABC transporter substrate-binding protein [Pseudomonadota bacterium]
MANQIFRLTAVSCLVFTSMIGSAFAADVLLRTAIIQVADDVPLPISRLDLPPEDLGFAGGQVALKDNRTTGQFLGQNYEVVEIKTTSDALQAEVDSLVDQGIGTVIAMASAETLLSLADKAAEHGILVLNAQATDDRLRNGECRANVMHVAPSRAQIADGLAQYMVWKKWTDWMLVHGSHPIDGLKADAYRRAAKKFGAKIVEERVFEDTGGARRTDSGHVLVQKQIPVFMQRADDHDVVVVADESQVFGYYLPYRGWDPRPVVGDAGLIASMWHAGHESWGATQLQRRFEKFAMRRMRDEDYLVWLAFRSLGEAVTRTGSTEPEMLKSYLLSDQFQIAGFKGLALSFRPWNNQMRHGVIMGDAKLVVTVSPQEEFLHQKSRLDTLGFDEPETACDFG